MKTNPPESTTLQSSKSLQAATDKIQSANRMAKVAKQVARLAKVKYKAAKDIFKKAKKEAKKAAKLAKQARKEHKTCVACMAQKPAATGKKRAQSRRTPKKKPVQNHELLQTNSQEPAAVTSVPGNAVAQPEATGSLPDSSKATA